MNISPEAKEAGMAECHDQTEGYGFHVQKLIAGLQSENARLLTAAQSALDSGAWREAFAMGQPWPLRDVLSKLIEATEHLLNDHDCDTDGHEQFRGCANRAKELLPIIDRALSQPPSGAWTSENTLLKSEVARLAEKLKEVEARESV